MNLFAYLRFFHILFLMLIKFGPKKHKFFVFLVLQGFFLFRFKFFFLHFATAFVGKNARKLLTIFLNDEIHFLVSFLP